MPVVKFLRLDEVLVFQKPGIDAEGPGADGPANRIVDRVAEHRGDRQHDQQHDDVDRVRVERCHGPGREEQGIARQKGRDHEAGFAEDDREQEHVGPRAPGKENLVQFLVEVEEEIEEGFQGIHGMSSAWWGVAVRCVPLIQSTQRIIVRAGVFANCAAP